MNRVAHGFPPIAQFACHSILILCEVVAEAPGLEREMAWQYVPDENPKRKHHWANNFAGFRKFGDTLVGKCPNNLSLQQCEALLNTGIPWTPDRWRKTYPKRIYNIHEGVVYRATQTVGGVSYHGFPERPNQFPREISDQLVALADQLGFGKEVRTWLKES